ncbi:MAG TPA: ABC transporter transmembrane domain-containing protein, partial [Sphingomicrobium sp.]|nr:ABC transporter transmembrane domain-containing protein [Sphingomicrobium sp.]
MTGNSQGGLLQSARAIYRFMSKQRRRHFWLALALMLIGGGAELLSIGAVIPFLALLAGGAETGKFAWLGGLFDFLGATSYGQQLAWTAGIFMAAAILAAAVRILLAWTTQSLALFLGHELSVEVQRRVLLQPYAYHVSHSSSEIVASLDKVQILIFAIVIQLMQATAAVVISLFIIGALMQVDLFTVAIAAATFASIYGLWATAVRRPLSRYSRIAARGYDERVQMVQEGLGGIREIILDHSQRAYLEKFAD